MTPARLAVVAVVAVVLATVVACGRGTASGTAPPTTPIDLASPVVGVPIDIDAEGFSKVSAFTIRTADGRQLAFTMGTLENAVEFPPNHLVEHLAGSTSIRVFFRDEDGTPVVYRLEDAEPVR